MFPLEAKVADTVSIIQEHFNLKEFDHDAPMGLYVKAENMWLEDGNLLRDYKGLKFLKSLEYRDKNIPIASPKIARFFAENPELRISDGLDSLTKLVDSIESGKSPEMPKRTPPAPPAPPAKQAPPATTSPPPIPRGPRPSFNGNPALGSKLKEFPIPNRPAPTPPSQEKKLKEEIVRLQGQIEDYQQLLEEGSEFIAEMTTENEELKAQVKSLQQKLFEKQDLIFKQTNEISHLKSIMDAGPTNSVDLMKEIDDIFAS
eukprot:TRINITY_DN2961_c0_g1_i1.p1 TRINITY_DN2961_c0_g1~~TRINITY_DN2961_c0_g1_i1.p1  ORF type:complete len:259 (-),score=72.95 TRINITY_DN2961_c0_g1_i1:44-820(-)